MSFTEFQCPSCAARLRLRDRNQLQRTIPCPDCGEKLTLEADGPDNVIAIAQSNDREPSKKQTTGIRKLFNPRAAAMIVAALVLMTLAFIVFGPDGNSDPTKPLPDGGANVALAKSIDQLPTTEETSPTDDAGSDSTPPFAELGDPPVQGHSNGSDAGTGQLADIAAPAATDNDDSMATDAETDPITEEPVTASTKPDAKSDAPPAGPDGAKVAAKIEKERLAKLAARLEQPILAYEQPKPVALSRLLLEWEELSGIDVRFADSVSEEMRQQTIALQLKDTTVQKVFDALIAEAKLISRTDTKTIVIDVP